jgi:hypothetical protein
MTRWVVLVVVLIILAASSYWYLGHLHGVGEVMSANDQAKSLEPLLGRAPSLQVPATNSTWVTHTGSLMSFSYPQTAKVYDLDMQNALKNPGVKDVFSFSVLSDHSTVVLQAVEQTGVTSLADDAAVVIRTGDSSYTEKEIQLSGHDGLEFDKTGNPSEHTAFFFANGLLFSLSATGYDDDLVLPLYQHVLSSWTF